MNLKIPESRTLRFIGIFIALFLVWMMIYEWVIHPWGKLDRLVINDNSLWSLFILSKLGFHTFIGNNPTIRTIGIDGTHGLWIGDPCDGITLFALFTFFIAAYPGKWIYKLFYIPAGITVIHFLNIFRIVLLCIIVKNHPSWLEFNHTYLFQILMYGIIFFMWYYWIKKFSDPGGLQNYSKP
ncbi:MAG: archaeosortase/exosortase family protein [Bacteroidetes bacterium]|nr:archaeosortase/exosortase family protein [Bacteroidota bacterium]